RIKFAQGRLDADRLDVRRPGLAPAADRAGGRVGDEGDGVRGPAVDADDEVGGRGRTGTHCGSRRAGPGTHPGSVPAARAIVSGGRHGFKCTVLFTRDKTDGTINPTVNNVPGLEALRSADLMVIFTRFLDLPDEQMAHVAAYLDGGKPVVGLRTATHAFNI